MKVKVAQYIADFLAQKGVSHIFTVTGGGAMHLNDAFGHHKDLTCVYNHHEQASAIAAEGYTRMSGKLCGVCVTSGPGGTNAITGVLGGWLDSIPMFVVSGQVKRETTIHATDIPLRQLGDQEYNIIDSIKPMTKYAKIILEPESIRYHLEKAYYLATTGRGGPVWIDVPLDVQASIIETDNLTGFDADKDFKSRNEHPNYDGSLDELVLKKIQESRKPVIIAGTGIRLGKAHEEFLKLADKFQIPVLTAWNAHDLMPDSNPYYCGRPGTVGTRGGNFIVQDADLLLILGCRMNIRQISYNFKQFSPDSYKIMVDIDENELRKPTLKIDLPIHADVKDFMSSILKIDYKPNHSEWLAWCRNLNLRYPAEKTNLTDNKNSDKINPYKFVREFTRQLNSDDKIVCGNGSACVITFQAAEIKDNTRLFTNSGCAAMGYGFPAAIGACYTNNGKRVICIDGDGSFQMNLQELQTVVYNNLNLKIIYLNNNGYHSIRQTQTNLFKGRELVGVCDGNGLNFPDAEKIANAYGIPFIRITDESQISGLIKAMETDGPLFAEIMIDETQNFEPKLSSKVQEDGTIVSPPIDDMFPFLTREEYLSNKFPLN